MLFSKFKISCDEATSICDKHQYGEASIYEKFKLFFHIMVCKFCVSYSKQNKIISKCVDAHKNSCKEKKKSLSEKDKNEIKNALDSIE